MLTFRPANPAEAGALSALCQRSKAVWGYDDAFMEACRAELSLSAEDFCGSRVQVAVEDGCVVGLVQVTVKGTTAELDKLFIEPAAMRAGAGRALFGWGVSAARAAGAHTLIIASDPGAAPFYRRMGAIDDGVVPSGSIPGRVLPQLRFDLSGQ